MASASKLTDYSFRIHEDVTEEIPTLAGKRDLVTVLKTYKQLNSIDRFYCMDLKDSCGKYKSDVDRQLSYFLKINQGGRIPLEAAPHAVPGEGWELRLVKEEHIASLKPDNASTEHHASMDPSSLWPLVLARSSTQPRDLRNCDDKSTAAYFLSLRHGPALENRSGDHGDGVKKQSMGVGLKPPQSIC